MTSGRLVRESETFSTTETTVGGGGAAESNCIEITEGGAALGPRPLTAFRAPLLPPIPHFHISCVSE